MTSNPPFSSAFTKSFGRQSGQPISPSSNSLEGINLHAVNRAVSPSVVDILIIDDDPSILTSLHRLLKKLGYRVATASDAVAGVQTAFRLVPSVIICDWLLPGDTSGLDICHRIKQDPQLSTTAFLMMTSHTDIANRVEALEAGADDLLIKPVDTAALIARVKSGMRLHQLTQALRAQTHRLQAELAEAATYVSSLLPTDTPKEAIKEGAADVSISSCFISSQELGGDCFDHYWLDPDYLVMYLLDVSGHGLGAALLSTSVLNVLRSQSLPGANFYRPETVLRGLNEAFQMNDQNDKYFTIWYGVYNRVTRELSYASAGHPPAILVSPTANIKRLRTPGMPIGMMPDATYQWQRCSITPSSRLYIFSDGIYEIHPAGDVHNPSAPLLGLDNFVHLLASLETHQKLGLETILEQVRTFSNNHFEDDLSLLEINFHP
ncbi:MAG: SpoIIE family protein phosphatase [Phormidesmis sp. RL_2_1]|nr:SpoIIE family protein phosphatase [Phormidesmis sp. RL_2_1]